MRRTSRGKPVAIPGCALRTLCSHYLIQWDFYRQEGLFQMTLRVSQGHPFGISCSPQTVEAFLCVFWDPQHPHQLVLVGNSNPQACCPESETLQRGLSGERCAQAPVFIGPLAAKGGSHALSLPFIVWPPVRVLRASGRLRTVPGQTLQG